MTIALGVDSTTSRNCSSERFCFVTSRRCSWITIARSIRGKELASKYS